MLSRSRVVDDVADGFAQPAKAGIKTFGCETYGLDAFEVVCCALGGDYSNAGGIL